MNPAFQHAPAFAFRLSAGQPLGFGLALQRKNKHHPRRPGSTPMVALRDDLAESRRAERGGVLKC
jgi:hypothetical protein